jgi:hypothetical protein
VDALDPEKLALVLKYGRAVRDHLPRLVDDFVAAVAREQDIDLPR